MNFLFDFGFTLFDQRSSIALWVFSAHTYFFNQTTAGMEEVLKCSESKKRASLHIQSLFVGLKKRRVSWPTFCPNLKNNMRFTIMDLKSVKKRRNNWKIVIDGLCSMCLGGLQFFLGGVSALDKTIRWVK